MRPAAAIGDRVDAIDTPALVIDLDAMERNLAAMAAFARTHRVALRPHAKLHKCAAIARLQIDAGAVGVCVQKLGEAEALADAGITDIYLSNELISEAKLARFAALAGRIKLAIAVDSALGIERLALALKAAGSMVDVFVEIDVGQGRCGVADAPAAIALAERIAAQPRLSLRGLQAYHGGIQHLRDWAARRNAAAQAAERTGAVLAKLAAAGVQCEVVTGGGSGSVEFDLGSGVYTEIQPGSYVFMDADYGSNAYPGALRFEHSLFIATTVMSVAAGDRVILDAGLKSMAVDSGLPWIWADGAASEALEYVAANDEHGIVKPRQAGNVAALPALGSRVLLVPGHCDPTLNLYDALVTVRGGVVEAVWPVAARGFSR
jgi:D-serine deaminase-like pyridoxal phosphate-dependent protein